MSLKNRLPPHLHRLAATVAPHRAILGATLLLTTLLPFTGCTNSLNTVPGLTTGLTNTTATSGTTGGISGSTGTSTNTGIDNFVISNASISAASGVGAQTVLTSIFFNTTLSTAPISNHCNTSGSGSTQTAKTCICQFSWNETNPNSATASPILRTVQTPVTSVQPSFVGCNAPDVYTTEVQNGTGVRITVLAGPSNPDLGLFTVNSFVFTKTSGAQSGSFSDAQGQLFDNILHYSCHQKFQRGLSITSRRKTQTDPATGKSASYLYGTKFCLASSSSGGSSSTSDCNNPPADYSAQAYYFNLYVRNSEKGDINQFNDAFICPMILESLGNNSSVGTQNQPWPLDTTFALSLGSTPSFSIGVEANTKLAGGQDPTASTNTCYPTNSSGSSGGTSNSNTIINSCLGFAARPNSDGTCPNVKDSSGLIRPTFRLRRYMAIFPRLFETTGAPSASAQAVDTIYVLDRPIEGPSTANPLKPYTMLGPKPCPFAFFDKKNVTDTSTGAQYHATSDPLWDDKNFDGIELPNADTASSCSASLPILSDDRSQFSITTVNRWNTSGLQHVWIRPVKSFLPHFEEDTNFQACAPQANPVKDPPLHFSRDPISHNVAWCAESYPTQNPNIAALDPALTGTIVPDAKVVPYTSHVVKRSASNPCTASQFIIPDTTTYSYPGGPANHPNTLTVDLDPDPALVASTLKANKTCDRTATTTGLAWPRFPLLAQPDQVESAISKDRSYFCTVTYDNSGGKTGKATPADGCCDANSVSVKTGLAGGSSAHLEPDVACKVPKY